MLEFVVGHLDARQMRDIADGVLVERHGLKGLRACRERPEPSTGDKAGQGGGRGITAPTPMYESYPARERRGTRRRAEGVAMAAAALRATRGRQRFRRI